MPDPIVGDPRSPASAAFEALRRLMESREGGIAEPGFGETLAQALGDVSQMQTDSKDFIAAFLRGEPIELHQVMAAAEEAAISLELLVEIRNKLADAYRSVMNMQA